MSKLHLGLRALSFDPERHRRVRHSIVSSLARRWGFRIYGSNAEWFHDDEFRRMWASFPEKKNLIHDRRYNLYGLAKAVAHVPGQLAECGVRFGRSSHVMLAASPGKHLYGFDSFEGLSEPAAEDLRNARHWSKHDFAATEDQANSNLAGHQGRFTLFAGWIPDRFGEVANETFNLVHVDVDLYQPTRDSLEFFWPRLHGGGLLVCDDYGSAACPGAKKAMDEFAATVGQKPASLATGQALLFKSPASKTAV